MHCKHVNRLLYTKHLFICNTPQCCIAFPCCCRWHSPDSGRLWLRTGHDRDDWLRDVRGAGGGHRCAQVQSSCGKIRDLSLNQSPSEAHRIPTHSVCNLALSKPTNSFPVLHIIPTLYGVLSILRHFCQFFCSSVESKRLMGRFC